MSKKVELNVKNMLEGGAIAVGALADGKNHVMAILCDKKQLSLRKHMLEQPMMRKYWMKSFNRSMRRRSLVKPISVEQKFSIALPQNMNMLLRVS